MILNNFKNYIMDKSKFSQNELLEMESLEVRGGASGSMGTQCECTNMESGCGFGLDQNKCANYAAACGCTIFVQNCDGH